MPKISELEKMATQVRRDLLRMVHGASSGHPGGSLGCTDLLTALYFEVMEYDADNFSMEAKDQDMFFLSNGHISPAWYSVLARSGHFALSELATFRKIDTRLQGHPTNAEELPGVRLASGSLGQGLSAAIGAAISKKLNTDDKIVYVLCGDGEIQEGQVWEAALFANQHKVDNLIAIIDDNGKQIDGPVDDVLSLNDLHAKWKAFGWTTVSMDGNNMASVLEGLNEAKKHTGKGNPVVIIMKTEMGCGVDFMMGTHKWHGVAPNDEQLEKALAQLDETLGDY